MITWGDKWMADEGGPPLWMTPPLWPCAKRGVGLCALSPGVEPKFCTYGPLTRPAHAANSWSSQNASLPAHRDPGDDRGEREYPGTPTSLIPSWRAGWPGQPGRSESRARPFGRLWSGFVRRRASKAERPGPFLLVEPGALRRPTHADDLGCRWPLRLPGRDRDLQEDRSPWALVALEQTCPCSSNGECA